MGDGGGPPEGIQRQNARPDLCGTVVSETVVAADAAAVGVFSV